MNCKMKLSIIVPVYNVEKYVERCLKSLCGLKISNEIIVVNDGSTDNSLEIVEKFKEKHSSENIKIISQENKGLSGARNTGIREAIGEYISFIDSDDFVDTEKFEELVNKTIENDLDIGQGNGIRYCKTSKKIFERDKKLNIIGINNGREWFKIFHKLENYRTEIWLNVYKREFLVDNGFYFIEGRLHEDEEYMIKTLLNAKTFKYFDIDFYYYFQENENSIMKNITFKNHYDMIENINEILKYSHNQNEEIKKIIYIKVRKYYKDIHNKLGESKEDIKLKKFIKKRYLQLKKNYPLKNYEESLLKKTEKFIRRIRDKILKRENK